MVEKVRGKLVVTLLLAFLLCCGISAIGATSGAAAEEGAAAAVPVIEIEGAAVRYPDEDETVSVGTGLRFSAKLTGVEDVDTIQDLGVLVNIEGEPTIENTPTGGVGVNIEYIKDGAISEEHKYVKEDGGLCMRVALTHIPANYFHHEFVCRAYYRLNGGEIVYSDVMERSVTYVIKAAIEDESETAPSAEQKAALQELRAASSDHTAEIALGVGKVIEPATENQQGSRIAFCACGAEVSTPVGLYRYTFKTAGGSDVQDITAHSYDTVVLPDDVTKDGAKFLGWYDANDNKIETVNVPYENKTGVEVTFTAKWLEYVTEEELVAGYDFDSEEALGVVSWDSGKFDVAYDETQSAVKIAPKEASQAVSVNIIEGLTLNAGDRIAVCALSAIDVGFRVNGKWRITLQEAGGTAFKNYVWTATETTVVDSMEIMPYTSKGELYIRSIQVIRKQNLSEKQLEAGVNFDSVAALGFVSCPEQYTVAYDETQNAVKISTTDTTQTVSVFVEEFTLNAGDKIVVRALSAVNVGFQVNGAWKKNLTIDGTEFTESVWEAEETITVTGMGIKLNSSKAAIYVQSIQVIRKQVLSAKQLEAGVNFDSVAALGFVSCPEQYTVAYDETQNAVKISTTDTTQTVSVNIVEGLTLNAGDQIVVRLLSAVNVGLYVNGEWKKDLTTDGTELTESESVWEAEETITVTGMGIKLNSKTAAIYVQSIKVVRA